MKGHHNLPRKGYKTITVNIKTFLRFLKSVKYAQKDDLKVSNSSFLESLLDLGSVKLDLFKSLK